MAIVASDFPNWSAVYGVFWQWQNDGLWQRRHDALGKRGWQLNHKRVERLWREEGMQVPKKQHRRRRIALGGSENSCASKRAAYLNHVWSYDLLEDRTESNRKLRLLAVIDEFTRESLAIEVDWSIKSTQVIDVLRHLAVALGNWNGSRGRCSGSARSQGIAAADAPFPCLGRAVHSDGAARMSRPPAGVWPAALRPVVREFLRSDRERRLHQRRGGWAIGAGALGSPSTA